MICPDRPLAHKKRLARLEDGWFSSIWKLQMACRTIPVPEFIDPVFRIANRKRSFSIIENDRFGHVFAKTGSINSGTGLSRAAQPLATVCSGCGFILEHASSPESQKPNQAGALVSPFSAPRCVNVLWYAYIYRYYLDLSMVVHWYSMYIGPWTVGIPPSSSIFHFSVTGREV
jgi:hypothetical protein